LINLISLFFVVRIYVILNYIFCSTYLIFDFELFSSGRFRFNFILLLDYFRFFFLWTVLLISSRVFIFRSSYIKWDKFYSRFHFLLFSFVVSIILLIFSPNLIRILIGWDGLGIRSYLLVIYYTTQKSYNAGIITFARNRIGDALIIITISYFIYLEKLNIFLIHYRVRLEYSWVIIIIIIAGFTKRAQIPFRAWLPSAIAAPTPVSALVHSSTLVTAGVYILFRFDYLISYLGLNKIILFIGVLTIFIARLRAFFEIDIKKIVALSTLSQLGVIITALGAGFRLLRFFHLLAHAFFKALLFIRAGNLIHRFERYQDLRVIGGASEILPFTKSIIIGCSIRLCGLPFMSAFYSKEIIIERLLTYNLSFISYFIIILGVLITIFYRIRFMVISIVSVTRQRSLFNKSDIDFKVNIRIILLFIPATTGGSMVNFFLDTTYFFLVRSKLKLIILFLLILGFIYFFKLYKLNLTTYTSLLWNMGSLWRLPYFSARLPIFLFLNNGDYLHKLSDFSWMNFIFSNLYLHSPIIGPTISLFQSIIFIRIFNNILIFILIIWIFIK